MVEIITNCPRCGARHVTLDVPAVNSNIVSIFYDWQHTFEVFGVCRRCLRASIHVVRQIGVDDDSKGYAAGIRRGELPKMRASLDRYFKVLGPISIKDEAGVEPPSHLPKDIDRAFREGASSCVIQNWNAAGSMFRLCIDLATKAKLPPADQPGIKRNERAKLGPRLNWLFAHGVLPLDLKGLSECIREDGNDGAHDGSLGEDEALDLRDFAVALLERLYTEPEKLRLAEARRAERRQPKK